MGVLDNIVGTVKGALYQAGESGAQNVLNDVLQNSSGGLQGVLDKLHAGGLGPIVSSWAGGQGQPISIDQLKGALGSAHIEEIASKLGIPADKALSALAEHLPAITATQKS